MAEQVTSQQGQDKEVSAMYDRRESAQLRHTDLKERHEIHPPIDSDTKASNALILQACRQAQKIYFSTGNDLGVATALTSLGEIYGAESKYAEAKEAFTEARDIYSCIGNDLGVADALIGLGEVYCVQSEYVEAEVAFEAAHKIYSRIGNDVGGANSLIGLGEVYSAQSEYAKAKEAFTEAREIHSRTGNDFGAANALAGLGEICTAQSKYAEAKNSFTEAHEIHSRVGHDLGVANALIGLGEIYTAQSEYAEAWKAFTEAHETHSRIGNNLGVANALTGLGKTYATQSKYAEANLAFKEAHKIHFRSDNGFGAANSLIGLGEVYSARSEYAKAKEAFTEARETHSRIGNGLGVANALIGLGEIYNAQSMYPVAKEAFKEAHEIHSRIATDLGVANALIGLGAIYSAQSDESEAKAAFSEAHEIYSRIGNQFGVANAVIGLGEIYSAQAEYAEAEEAFTEAHEIHFRISNPLGIANVLIDLGDVYGAQSKYSEAEVAFKEAHNFHSHIGNYLGAAGAIIRLGETYNIQLRLSEADYAFKQALEIVSRVEQGLRTANMSNNREGDYDDQSSDPGDEQAQGINSHIDPDIIEAAKLRDCDTCGSLGEAQDIHSGIDTGTGIEFPESWGQLSDSEVGAFLIHSTSTKKPNQADLSEFSAPSDSFQISTPSHNANDLLNLFRHLAIDDDVAPSPTEPIAKSLPNTNRQEQFLSEELTAIAHASVPAIKELVDLLEELGKAAPKAVRHKHKIYSILRVARDICNYTIELGNPPERQIDSSIKAHLHRMEEYCVLHSVLEEALLELAMVLPSEITAFGTDLYSSWSHSRSAFAGILTKLRHAPLPTTTSNTLDIADDSLFDDCSWLSRLLNSGIHPEISTQFPHAPNTHPVFVVMNGLRYLEAQIKRRVIDEPTRELIIDVTTSLAQKLASPPLDNDNKAHQDQDSVPTGADRDSLINALAKQVPARRLCGNSLAYAIWGSLVHFQFLI